MFKYEYDTFRYVWIHMYVHINMKIYEITPMYICVDLCNMYSNLRGYLCTEYVI